MKKKVRVDWYKLARGSLHIPRHSFIVLSAILNRLTIKTGGLERDGALKSLVFSLALLSERYGARINILQACWR